MTWKEFWLVMKYGVMGSLMIAVVMYSAGASCGLLVYGFCHTSEVCR